MAGRQRERQHRCDGDPVLDTVARHRDCDPNMDDGLGNRDIDSNGDIDLGDPDSDANLDAIPSRETHDDDRHRDDGHRECDGDAYPKLSVTLSPTDGPCDPTSSGQIPVTGARREAPLRGRAGRPGVGSGEEPLDIARCDKAPPWISGQNRRQRAVSGDQHEVDLVGVQEGRPAWLRSDRSQVQSDQIPVHVGSPIDEDAILREQLVDEVAAPGVVVEDGAPASSRAQVADGSDRVRFSGRRIAETERVPGIVRAEHRQRGGQHDGPNDHQRECISPASQPASIGEQLRLETRSNQRSGDDGVQRQIAHRHQGQGQGGSSPQRVRCPDVPSSEAEPGHSEDADGEHERLWLVEVRRLPLGDVLQRGAAGIYVLHG